jgi:signal peptidase I
MCEQNQSGPSLLKSFGPNAMMTLLLYASLLIGSFLLHAVFFWLGARLTKAAKPTFLRSLAAAVCLFLVNVLTLVMAGWMLGPLGKEDAVLELVIGVGLLLWEALIACLIFKLVFVTSTLRAALICLLGLIPTIAALAFVFLVVRPYVMEAYVIPSFAMAPTLLNWHKNGVCPHCGQTLFIPTPPPNERLRSGYWDVQTLGVCSQCFQANTVETEDIRSEPIKADHIIADKLISPRRWDIVVFRSTEDPALKYPRRVVGLPGEKVFIKDGAIWVNGVRQTPPEDIRNLQFSSESQLGSQFLQGTPEQPWVLGDDEFCVLGDFTLQSNDSRDFGPVKRSQIEGVVTIRYLPISRWRIFR